MKNIANLLNPFTQNKFKTYKTPWGKIIPDVDIFPIIYLLFIYGFIYILPYGRNFLGISWFDWFRTEDGPLEWLQFIFFLGTFVCSLIILWLTRRRKEKKERRTWLCFALLSLFVAGEEISWGERLTGFGFDVLRKLNEQGESNIHNSEFFHHTLLDPSIIFLCLFLGWICWRVFPDIEALPNKYYSLYFLPVALFYFYYDISYASTIKQIRYDGEIFELLISIGLFSHCWNNLRKILTTTNLRTYLS